jgi:hypothetical protein
MIEEDLVLMMVVVVMKGHSVCKMQRVKWEELVICLNFDEKQRKTGMLWNTYHWSSRRGPNKRTC